MILGLLQNDLQMGVILIITLIFSLSFHEFAHAYVAHRLGDNTSAYQGRLTLNPLAHLDPIGSLMLLFVGFGYAKPVPVNPVNLSNPREDMMKIAFAGPASNLLLCFISCIMIRLLGSNAFDYVGYSMQLSSIGLMLYIFAIINMTLAVFNMKYKDELIKSMKFLGKQDNTIFVGQQTEFKGNALYNTMVDVPQDKRLEFPVAEELQMGFCTGLSLEGYVPISFYPRMDFIILTFNQLINHLDKFENMTNGKYKPKQIIRTAIGSLEPLNGGVQHTQDYTESFKQILKEVKVVMLDEPEDIFMEFQKAYFRDGSTLLIEHGDYYNDK